MTYLTFHLVFILPPILLMLFYRPQPMGLADERRVRFSIPAVCVLALLYTTPWDNYLVYRDVWGYGPDRVLATIGYVPVEEYLFFLLQPILTGLCLYHVLDRTMPAPLRPEQMPRSVGGLAFGIFTVAGALMVIQFSDEWLYLGLILVWASPLLAAMWLIGGDLFWQRRRTVLLSVGLPTLYLWGADRIALGLGIWEISETYTTGFAPLGLPIEEALFFLFTNLLVVQGLMLFLFGSRLPNRFPSFR